MTFSLVAMAMEVIANGKEDFSYRLRLQGQSYIEEEYI